MLLLYNLTDLTGALTDACSSRSRLEPALCMPTESTCTASAVAHCNG